MRLLAVSTPLNVVPRRRTPLGISFDEVTADMRKLGVEMLNRLEGYRGNEEYDTRATGAALSTYRFIAVPTDKDRAVYEKLRGLANQEFHSLSDFAHRFLVPARDRARELLHTKWSPEAEAIRLFDPILEFDRLYIPTLRSLREITSSSDDVFEKQTRAAYFKTANNVRVFTGLNLYEDVTGLLLGHHDERERIRDFECFIGDSFFEGKPVSLVPKQSKNGSPRELTIKIGTEKEYPIRELGDGIQSIIILTFPLFMQGDKPLLAFIEEPELFMHPWLQRVFLEVLSKRFPSHQYFLTTHSNHFLDLTLDVDDVSVFTLEKMLQGDIQKQQEAQFAYTHVSGGDRRPLELLGVRNSSVFLSNCTIWIEGITDRRYVAHWLELYQQHLTESGEVEKAQWFKEDLHYSFVEYSGANLVHWSLLDEDGPDVERLCGRLFLIADSDGAKEGSAKYLNHRKLEAKLGKDFCLLPAKEIENLTKPEVLLEVLKAYGEDETNLKLPAHTSYLNRPLGEFIEQKVLIDSAKKKRAGSYAKDKTISDKSGFCCRAIAATPIWQDMSKEAQELAALVFEFIQTNNPRP